jgi:hypothetical protein
MDGSSISAGKGMTATVVRQYTSSRIERQLLAQAFELVCGSRCDVEESSLMEPYASRSHGVSEGGQAIEPCIARRRAA